VKVFGPNGFGLLWTLTAMICSMFRTVTLVVRLARGRSEPRVVPCPAKGCGVGGDDVPSRWPFHCTECGTPADPDFDEPWVPRGPGTVAAVAARGIASGGSGRLGG